MQQRFMEMAIERARASALEVGHGPFGAVVVKGDDIVGIGINSVTGTNDPTAHAEVCAIRNACSTLNTFSLEGCEIYTTCEPCPMCLGAIYWAHLGRIYFGATRLDAARINFDDSFIYDEIAKPIPLRRVPMLQMMRDQCLPIFTAWEKNSDKVHY